MHAETPSALQRFIEEPAWGRGYAYQASIHRTNVGRCSPTDTRDGDYNYLHIGLVRRVSLNSHVSDLRNLAGMVYAFRNSSGNLRYVGRNPPRLKLSCSLKSRGS
jgi:hypothetical protein